MAHRFVALVPNAELESLLELRLSDRQSGFVSWTPPNDNSNRGKAFILEPGDQSLHTSLRLVWTTM